MPDATTPQTTSALGGWNYLVKALARQGPDDLTRSRATATAALATLARRRRK